VIDSLKEENIDFIMWLSNSPDIKSVDYAVCGAFSNESITDENITRWKNEDSDNQSPSGNDSLTAALMSDVVVFTTQCVVKKDGEHIISNNAIALE